MTGDRSQRVDELEISRWEGLRDLATRGLGQTRLWGGRAVIMHLQGCRAEEGADRGFQGFWDAGWRILGGTCPPASQRLSCRLPDAGSALALCVCECVSMRI